MPAPADRDSEHVRQRLRISHSLCQCNVDVNKHGQPDGLAVWQCFAVAQPHAEPIAGEGTVHTLASDYPFAVWYSIGAGN